MILRKKSKLEKVNEYDIVAEGEDFQISKREYVDFKENLSQVHKINGVPSDLNNEQIIDQIMKKIINSIR